MKSIELFAGIGGISLAAEWAGIETVAFCEIDDYAGKVLKKNWPNVPLFKDIKQLNKQVLEESGVIERGRAVELISGGFPCQPYSTAGKRKGKGDDRDLWPEMFRIIEEIKPAWVVGENVANFANMELDRTLSDLENIGYEGRAFILPALSVGAPHRRDRTFVVANSKRSGWAEVVLSHNSRKSEETHERWKAINDGPLSSKCTWEEWEAKSGVSGIGDGFSKGLDRLRCLGNAVVPQQIYPIFKAIMEIEKMRSD